MLSTVKDSEFCESQPFAGNDWYWLVKVESLSHPQRANCSNMQTKKRILLRFVIVVVALVSEVASAVVCARFSYLLIVTALLLGVARLRCRLWSVSTWLVSWLRFSVVCSCGGDICIFWLALVAFLLLFGLVVLFLKLNTPKKAKKDPVIEKYRGIWYYKRL